MRLTVGGSFGVFGLILPLLLIPPSPLAALFSVTEDNPQIVILP